MLESQVRSSDQKGGNYERFLNSVDLSSLARGKTPKERLSEIVSYTFALEGASKCWQGNLDRVRERIIEDHPELGIDELYIGELDYRRFWKRCKDQPGVPLEVPHKLADLWWHTHLWFTRQYRMDSHEYFGYFLEHEPKARGKCGGRCQGDGRDGGGVGRCCVSIENWATR